VEVKLHALTVQQWLKWFASRSGRRGKEKISARACLMPSQYLPLTSKLPKPKRVGYVFVFPISHFPY
jgi:hypothetical protein